MADRPKIRIGTDQEADFMARLDRMANEAAEFKGNWDQLHDSYWRQYLALPGEQQKTFPWPGANNFYAPLTAVSVDVLSSMFFDAMFSARPRVIGTDEVDQEVAEKLDRFYFEHVFKKIISLDFLGNDWNQDTLIDGTSAIKFRWSRDRFLIREDEIDVKLRPVTETEKAEIMGMEVRADIPVSVEVDTRITERTVFKQENRPVVETVDMARLFIAPGTRAGLEPSGSLQWPNCPWYFEEMHVSSDKLRQMRMAGWDGLEEEGEVFATLQEPDLTQRELTQSGEEGSSTRRQRSALMRVYFMRVALPGEYVMPDGGTKRQGFDDPSGIPEETVVWYFPVSRTVSRIEPLSRVLPDNKRPHIDNRYNRLSRFFYAPGIPAKLRHIQKLYNSGIRQMIDYGTVQNMPWAFYEPATTGLVPSMQQIKPGGMIAVNNARGVHIPRFQGNHTFWMTVEQISQQWMERLTAVTDFTVGRAPSVPNAPRTARGQNQMIQQANISFSYRVALMAVAYEELFYRIHTIYKRNATEDLEFKYFNQSIGQFTREKVTRDEFMADVDFTFELNPNRQLESQQAQNRLALVSNIPWLAQDPESMRNAVRDVYAADGKLEQFERVWPQEKLEIHTQAQEQGQQTPPMIPSPPEGGLSNDLAPLPERKPKEEEEVVNLQ